MHVSYAELVRMGPEAIRMTGFTFGQADDAVDGIVWTESVLGRGYDLLRMADCRRPKIGWPQHTVEVDGVTATIKFDGAPAYGFAARLADIAAEIATTSLLRVSSIRAFAAFGGWIVPYIAYRLARNQAHAAVFWRPPSTAQADEAPAMLVFAEAAADKLAVPPLVIMPAGLFPTVESRMCPSRTLPRRLLEPIIEATDSLRDTSLIAVAAMTVRSCDERVEMGSAVEALEQLGLSMPSASLDASDRLRRVVELGMEVEPEDHVFLNGLSQRIRLPNTERSKSQAG